MRARLHADVNKIANFSSGLIWRPASSEVIKEQQARLAVIAPSSNFGVFLSPLFLLFALAAEALFDVMPSDDVIAPSFRRSGVLRAWRMYSVDLTGASAVSASDTAVMLIVLVLIRGCFYGLEIGVSDYLRKSARAKPQNAEQEEEAHVVSPTKEMLAMIRMIVTVRAPLCSCVILCAMSLSTQPLTRPRCRLPSKKRPERCTSPSTLRFSISCVKACSTLRVSISTSACAVSGPFIHAVSPLPDLVRYADAVIPTMMPTLAP